MITITTEKKEMALLRAKNELLEARVKCLELKLKCRDLEVEKKVDSQCVEVVMETLFDNIQNALGVKNGL